MAVGTTAAILGLASLGTIGAVGASKLTQKNPKLASPMALPQPPSVDSSGDRAAQSIRAKRASATQSVYTSPLGVSGQADVARKTLLGQ